MRRPKFMDKPQPVPAPYMPVPLARRLPWYVFQIAVVTGVVLVDAFYSEKPDQRVFILGVGLAFISTIFLQMLFDRLRRLIHLADRRNRARNDARYAGPRLRRVQKTIGHVSRSRTSHPQLPQ